MSPNPDDAIFYATVLTPAFLASLSPPVAPPGAPPPPPPSTGATPRLG